MPSWGFPDDSGVTSLPANEGDMGLTPTLGRSSGVGNGSPLQYSCQEKFHGQGSLVSYSLWGSKELDMTEQWTMALCQCCHA